ncbi:MAG: hypothetical protein ACR2NA_06445 [Solirubrobacterales bacterium]
MTGRPALRLARPSALALVLLACVVLAGGGLRAYKSANPSGYTSADESAYSLLATTIATGGDYRERRRKGMNAFRWPPGAPFAFAAAHKVTGDLGPGAVYWLQFAAGTLTICGAFLLAWWLAGPWAGLAAAALVAFYLPLARISGDLLSEPLGGLLMVAAMGALAWAYASRRIVAFGLAGALLGGLVLTRADHLLLPGLLAILAVGVGWRVAGARSGLAWGAALLAGTVVVMAPWAVYASRTLGNPVPVTTGSSTPLFVGTYLPGGGTTAGLKRDLAPQIKANHPTLAAVSDHKLPARFALDVIAARHPEASRTRAISIEGRKNLVRYGLKDPIDFTAMMFSKASRMWLSPYNGGGHHATEAFKAHHNLWLIPAVLGLIAGLVRTRDPVLASILLAALLSTALHAVVVSQARYNLPLMPIVLAGGAAGWAMALRGVGARVAGRGLSRPKEQPAGHSRRAAPA